VVVGLKRRITDGLVGVRVRNDFAVWQAVRMAEKDVVELNQ